MKWFVLAIGIALALTLVTGCGEPSAAEIVAREDAAFWRGLALFFGIVALVVGIVIGVSAAKRGDAADRTVTSERGPDDPAARR